MGKFPSFSWVLAVSFSWLSMGFVRALFSLIRVMGFVLALFSMDFVSLFWWVSHSCNEDFRYQVRYGFKWFPHSWVVSPSDWFLTLVVRFLTQFCVRSLAQLSVSDTLFSSISSLNNRLWWAPYSCVLGESLKCHFQARVPTLDRHKGPEFTTGHLHPSWEGKRYSTPSIEKLNKSWSKRAI